MNCKIVYVLLFVLVKDYTCYIAHQGPQVKATKGEIVPKPQSQEKSDNYFIIRPKVFRFDNIGKTCKTLDEALIRYWNIISTSNSVEKRSVRLATVLRQRHSTHNNKPWLEDRQYLGLLDKLEVDLKESCDDSEYPSIDMKEIYTLNLTSKSRTLSSNTLWGILRGLETFSQLIYLAEDEYTLVLNATNIYDYPRLAHRGLLLDTSRHFIPMYAILQTLEAMSYNKFNVFHWHITDDQSFPYKSAKFPQLSEQGAYHPIAKVYEPFDVERVIEYGRQRGIRVIVEFDTPGHTRSWGESRLTPCYVDSKPSGEYGPMDPTNYDLYIFLEQFFKEIKQVFPDSYVHLGGDEVEFDCWASNPEINRFMKKLNITGDYAKLENYYIQKLINIVDELKFKTIVWEEVFDNGVVIPNDTVVHVWRDDFSDMLNRATKAGKYVIFSSCWYLDHLGQFADWINFYNCDPYNFPGNDEQKHLVLGGEACMWGESVNEYNVISRVWPRACAAAEKLWSSITNKTNPIVTSQQLLDASQRLEEHTCRMNYRGIQAQPPNGAGFCL